MQGMGVWGLAPRSLQISLSSAQPSLSATYRYEKSTPDILYSGGPALISSYAAFPIINGMKFGALTRRKFIDEPDMSPDCSTHFEMDLSQDSGRSTQKRRKHKTSRKKLLADGRRLNTNYVSHVANVEHTQVSDSKSQKDLSGVLLRGARSGDPS